MLNTNADLTKDQLERLKEIYVDAKVHQMSYETLIDYVKADFYQDVEKYSSLNKKIYNYSLEDDIIYDFDKQTLGEWINQIRKEES